MSAAISIKPFFVTACGLALMACQAKPQTQQAAFFDALSAHCGKAYSGRLVSTDAVDADFATKAMVMHVRECSDTVIRIPFHVDDDRSRTWVISKTGQGLRLKHDHRHEDGSEDAVTQYGGDTEHEGSSMRQSFPVDQFSINMFSKEGLTASVVNVWSVGIDDKHFTYELTRPNRLFRVQFDLSQSVDLPPRPWGAE